MLEIYDTTSSLPSNGIQLLTDHHKSEVLNFLSARPLHTFVKASWIKDNGLVSPLNRGTFYGYRDWAGRLEGVALIGHLNLFETRNDGALAAFAQLAQTCPTARVILGEKSDMSRFMLHYSRQGTPPRRVCNQQLLVKQTTENLNTLSTLRPADSNDLPLVAPVHAQSAFAESGINPLDVDPQGFKKRYVRRIQQGRVWVVIEDGHLKFKADIVSQTPDVAYLEGVYVSPDHRGNGFGARCVTQLTNHLLEHTKTVCLMVNEKNPGAQASYRKAGFVFRQQYETVYLK